MYIFFDNLSINIKKLFKVISLDSNTMFEAFCLKPQLVHEQYKYTFMRLVMSLEWNFNWVSSILDSRVVGSPQTVYSFPISCTIF